ncbi:hypothetical protein ACFFNY_16355 [Paenibacillus hodogayensis]|uniref:Uncharacterized protein n=1 Tax=Paenibacillus hodogayensis TaxID=279208 RepID=A0ABV5VXV7_9BACL
MSVFGAIVPHPAKPIKTTNAVIMNTDILRTDPAIVQSTPNHNNDSHSHFLIKIVTHPNRFSQYTSGIVFLYKLAVAGSGWKLHEAISGFAKVDEASIERDIYRLGEITP